MLTYACRMAKVVLYMHVTKFRARVAAAREYITMSAFLRDNRPICMRVQTKGGRDFCAQLLMAAEFLVSDDLKCRN